MGFLDNLTKGIRDVLSNSVDDLMLSDADSLPDRDPNNSSVDKAIGQKAIIDDPFFDNAQQHFIFKNKMSRISNKTLKDTSVRDWLISAIIQARSDTMLLFSRPQRKQFDTGFKIYKKKQHSTLTESEREEISNIEDFILNCGRKKGTPPGEEMLFGEFLKLCTRDAITFGHIAIEKVLTRSGGLHRIRPLPSESMYLINKKTSRDIIAREINNAKNVTLKVDRDQNNPSVDFVYNEADIDYYKYVQMSYDNRVLSAFGDEDLIWKVANPQNFADSMGYCYSTLELAILNITNHLNVENYNSNFFTQGYAARGILHLKGTVTQSQLTAFRRQFYNTISGVQNAWRTPIVSGLDDVQWVGLSGSAREMEYLNYNNHLMRALCTQFQIDPVELGLDYLASPTGRSPMQQANNEYKITYSRERGLYPLLMMFEDLINKSVLPAIDPEFGRKYEFKFVGYTDETPQTNVSLLQAEMTVHSSMNDLLKKSEKPTVDHPIFDVPLNSTFWEIADKLMTKAEQREFFLKDKSAMSKRELAYIPGDPGFMGWQQLLMTMDSSREQMRQQKEQMKIEQEQAEKQDSREQEQHDAQMNDIKDNNAQKSIKQTAKEYGLGNKPLEIGGKPVKNPINEDS